jgi:hypothetical protein
MGHGRTKMMTPYCVVWSSCSSCIRSNDTSARAKPFGTKSQLHTALHATTAGASAYLGRLGVSLSVPLLSVSRVHNLLYGLNNLRGYLRVVNLEPYHGPSRGSPRPEQAPSDCLIHASAAGRGPWSYISSPTPPPVPVVYCTLPRCFGNDRYSPLQPSQKPVTSATDSYVRLAQFEVGCRQASTFHFYIKHLAQQEGGHTATTSSLRTALHTPFGSRLPKALSFSSFRTLQRTCYRASWTVQMPDDHDRFAASLCA